MNYSRASYFPCWLLFFFFFFFEGEMIVVGNTNSCSLFMHCSTLPELKHVRVHTASRGCKWHTDTITVSDRTENVQTVFRVCDCTRHFFTVAGLETSLHTQSNYLKIKPTECVSKSFPFSTYDQVMLTKFVQLKQYNKNPAFSVLYKVNRT